MKEDMLVDRSPMQVENPLVTCHPDYAIEHVDDLEPMIESYLEQTNQALIQKDRAVDAVSSAS